MKYFIACCYLVLTLTGCSLLIDTHLIPPIRFTLQKAEPVYKPEEFLGCRDKFVLPKNAPLPKVPVISADVADNRAKTEKILLDYIKQLKSILKEEHITLQETYQEYLDSCK